jgi:ATP-binding cassette subfamily C protein
LQKNSSELVKGVLSDTNEFSNNFLSGIIDFIINLLMIMFILVLLFLVNIQVTLYIIGFFVLIYGSLTFFSKSKLRKSGIRVMNAQRDKHKYAYEALNSFKISKAQGIEDFFLERYSKSSKKAQKYQLFSKILSDIPKNIVEAMVFCGLAASIVVIIIQDWDINKIIPTMSVYVISGYRIMPEVAKLFSSISGIIHHRPVVDRLYDELIVDSDESNERRLTENKLKGNNLIHFEKSISLKDIVFYYKNSDVIIDHISLEIPHGSVIGFAGTTGAGKTTLIDIIMGLLKPDEGELLIDDKRIVHENVRQWRNMLGYVPQEIFLIDDTIRANIAFGIPVEEIDDEKIRKAAQISAISDFIESELPDKYQSMIGERGVRLSGGQRQRLGLARALYRNPKVLILDEATSALDGATEESVVSSIHSLSNVQTIIIIAHRLNTLKPCNQIYLMEHGQIIDQGTFHDLIENNQKFRQMAKYDQK